MGACWESEQAKASARSQEYLDPQEAERRRQERYEPLFAFVLTRIRLEAAKRRMESQETHGIRNGGGALHRKLQESKKSGGTVSH
jgi:hypothetical protein